LAGSPLAVSAVLGLGPHRLRPQHCPRLPDRVEPDFFLRSRLLLRSGYDRLPAVQQPAGTLLRSRLLRFLFLGHHVYDLRPRRRASEDASRRGDRRDRGDARLSDLRYVARRACRQSRTARLSPRAAPHGNWAGRIPSCWNSPSRSRSTQRSAILPASMRTISKSSVASFFPVAATPMKV